MAPPGPRPGTLEWLADQRPDELVLFTPDEALTRTQWEARAGTLADELAGEHGVAEGTLLSGAGRLGPDWFVLSWAAAKLGAGLAGLPPGPVTGLEGALHVEPPATAPDPDRPPTDPPIGNRHGRNDGAAPRARRFSGVAAPPDSVTFSRLGRPVRRSFTPASVAGIGEGLADLIARVRAVPGTTLVCSAAVSDPVASFVATVVLVGGGRVLTAPTPGAALALAAKHGATLAAVSPADLDELSRLDVAAHAALDLTGIEALVTGAALLGGAARRVVEDLFGAAIDVYATADTGVVAVRAPGAPHHELLDGVSVRRTKAGLLEVRSPLAATPGWVATGDRAALVGDAGLQLL